MLTAPLAFAQDPVLLTDEETGIQFVTVAQEGDASVTFGIALPPTALTEDTDEYIGLLVCGAFRCCASRISNAPMPPGVEAPPYPDLDPALTQIRRGAAGGWPDGEDSVW